MGFFLISCSDLIIRSLSIPIGDVVIPSNYLMQPYECFVYISYDDRF